MTIPSKFVTVVSLVAAAISAYEQNNEQIVRDDCLHQGIELHSNRELMSKYLDGNHSYSEEATNAHYAQAEDVIAYLQQVAILQTLAKGNTTNFLAKIVELLVNDTVLRTSIGLIAWAPKVAADFRKKDGVREISSLHEHTSCHIGSIGSTIAVDFTLIEQRFIKSLKSWSVLGYTTDGNLIFYWARRADAICKQGQIKGRVRSHVVDAYRNKAKVTSLNYVKIL